jgi:hypothetical protein
MHNAFIIHCMEAFVAILWSDRTGTMSIICCPRRGMIQLHILRGMKAEVITASVAMCIHGKSVEPIMWMWIVWIFTLWFILALSNWLFAYLLQINLQEESYELCGCLSTVGLHCPIVVCSFFTCWDVSSHSCIVWCRHLISVLGKKGCSSTTTTPLNNGTTA